MYGGGKTLAASSGVGVGVGGGGSGQNNQIPSITTTATAAGGVGSTTSFNLAQFVQQQQQQQQMYAPMMAAPAPANSQQDLLSSVQQFLQQLPNGNGGGTAVNNFQQPQMAPPPPPPQPQAAATQPRPSPSPSSSNRKDSSSLLKGAKRNNSNTTPSSRSDRPLTSGIAATSTPGNQAQAVGFPSDSSAASASSALPTSTRSAMSQLLQVQSQAQQGGNPQNSPVPNFQALMAQQQQQQQPQQLQQAQPGLGGGGNPNNLPMLVQNLLGGSLQVNNAPAPAAPPVSNGWSSALVNNGPVASQGQVTQDALELLLQAYSKQPQQQQQQPQPKVLPTQAQQPPALPVPPGTDATTVAGIQQLVQLLSSGNTSSSIAAIATVVAAAALSTRTAQPATQQYAAVPQENQESVPRATGVKSSSATHRHVSSGDNKKASVAQKKKAKTAKPAKPSRAKPSPPFSSAAMARSSAAAAAAATGASTEKKKKVNLTVAGKDKDDADWGKPGVDYTCYPCPARSVAATDHYRIGVLRIPKNVRHSQELLCTHPACRGKGVRFLYCSFCEQPVAKANFGTRHRHLEEKQRQAREAAIAKKKEESAGKKRKSKGKDKKHKKKKKKVKAKDEDQERKALEGREALLRSSAFSALLGAATAALPQETGDDKPSAAKTTSSKVAADSSGDAVFPKRKKLRLSLHAENTGSPEDPAENKEKDEAISPSSKADQQFRKEKDDSSPSECAEGDTSSDIGDVPDTILFRKKGRKRRHEPEKKRKEAKVTNRENAGSSSESRATSSDSDKRQDESTSDSSSQQGTDERNTSDTSSQRNPSDRSSQHGSDDRNASDTSSQPGTDDGSDNKGMATKHQTVSKADRLGMSIIDGPILDEWRSILGSRPANSKDHDATEKWIQKVIRVSTKATTSKSKPDRATSNEQKKAQ